MGDFTSEYRDQDGRVTTRVDTVKSIDSFATIITWLLFGVFILLWKILKCINSSDCKKGRYFLLSLFTGGLGFNNFYAKQYIMGFIKLGIMGTILFMASGVLVDKKTAEHMVTLILPVLLFLTVFSLFEAIFYSLDNSSTSTTPSKKAPSIFLAFFLNPFHKLYQKNYLEFILRLLPILLLILIISGDQNENLFGFSISWLLNQDIKNSIFFIVIALQALAFIEAVIYIFTLNAQPYTKQSILGVWEVSSLKLNGFTSFGKEFSTNRGETYTLLFNKRGFVKNQTTNTIYNYEIINGELKIYQTKTYKYGNQVKDTRHYDLWKISGTFENCYKSKIIKKKMTGSYRKEGYKWCKVQDYPQPVLTNTQDYNFK